MSTESLERRVQQAMDRVAADQPTTAEDVQVIALYWAVSDQQTAAAAGTTTGADLELLTVVRANPRDGDAAAQTVCDAACRWRDHTRLDRGDEPGSFRWLLAQTVDRHRRSPWKRHRMRIALWLGFLSGGFFAAEGIMSLAGVGPPPAHQAAIAAAVACFAAAMLITFLFNRSTRR